MRRFDQVPDLLEPFDDALRVGPPLPSQTWDTVVAARRINSLVWRPRSSDGRMFRFVTPDGDFSQFLATWESARLVYGSDPPIRSSFKPAEQTPHRGCSTGGSVAWPCLRRNRLCR
ncbi:alpha/beta-hydrolase family protein [Tabrizicola sp. BL-A-41-H6]|uniref:alpha/beta-hydrolase family protein n=1 Tax=Tabrizicola sp. BL-A-41-H6 TaxID=3421107 RepID=UPI003D677514